MRKRRSVIIALFVAVAAALSMGADCDFFGLGGENGFLFFGG
jgi:hypothetical protein